MNERRGNYDYVIVGGGMGGLTAGALLAHAGARVAVLEAHEYAGGYCHTFPMGKYQFCAAVHYIFSCGEGEPVYNVLRKLGLHERITFERLDPEGYDHFSCPSEGLRFRIPNGLNKWGERRVDRFPAERDGIRRCFAKIQALWAELQVLPEEVGLRNLLTTALKVPHLLRHRSWTLQQLFDDLRLSKPVQAILSTQVGDLGLPPAQVSLLIYTALVSRYGDGAYYPTEHFSALVDGLAEVVRLAAGCTLSLNTEVTGVRMRGGRIDAVVTADGREIQGETFICNADPKWFVDLVGRTQFPASISKQLGYDYSASSFSVYLGVRGLDLRDHGFGNWNVWHYTSLDVNGTYAAQHDRDDLSNPWIFMSTPSLCSPASKTRHAPEGEQILELITTCAFAPLDGRKALGVRDYTKRKVEIRDGLIDVVERHYVPGLREHVVMRVAGSPTTNKHYLRAPGGNIYGAALTPRHVAGRRLESRSAIENLYFTGATATFPSIGGTVSGAARLYSALTGDSLESTSLSCPMLPRSRAACARSSRRT